MRCICDCERVFSTPDQVIACADRNHGLLDPRRLCGQRLRETKDLPLIEQRFCLLFANHEGDCGPLNPEIDLYYGGAPS